MFIMFILKKYQLILILFCIILIGCKKEEPDYYYLSDYSQEWLNFNVGDYWTYIEDSLNIIDSIILIENEFDTLHYFSDNQIRDIAEEQYLRFYNSDQSVLWQVYLKSNILNNGNLITLSVDDNNQDISYNADLLYFDSNSIITDFKRRNTEKESIIISKLDSLIILNEIYRDVIHVNCKFNVYDSSNEQFSTYLSSTDYWIAKNNWIVKMILRTQNETYYWSLLRSNIKN